MKRVFLTDLLGDPDYSVGDVSKLPPVEPEVLIELCCLADLLLRLSVCICGFPIGDVS